MILCAVGSFKLAGCCGFPLSCFGHDRAKNDSGIKLPSQCCELLVCYVYAVVGLGLCWSGNEGMGCLINLACFGAAIGYH